MSDVLRDAAENAVSACLPFLPLEGSWGDGYRLSQHVHSEVRALPEEWTDAALAISELHRALAIEPEYEWSISFGEYESAENRSTYANAEVAQSYVARYGASHVERRVKAGPWERVDP